MESIMSVMITGATGFIGTHVAKQLAARGESLHVLCRPTADLTPLQGLPITVFRGDILDRASVAACMEGCDRVFHLAAYARNWAKDGSTFSRINVGAVTNILESARDLGVKRTVFTSTNLTMSTTTGAVADEATPRTTELFTDYEVSKTLAEKTARAYADQGVDVVIVNPSRVFGPGLLSEGNSTTIMIKMYLEGRFRTILGSGNAVGNWSYVEDVARGHLLAMEHGRSGERYLLGGDNASFSEFFRLLAEVSGTKRLLVHVPAAVAFALAHTEVFRGRVSSHHPLISPGWVKIFLHDWAHSTAKAEREFGYTVTPLREALDVTVRWIREQDRRNDHAKES
ncbi:MAG: SDR family oxidoreductase [Candidatus Kapaibacterium sp.]